MLKLLVEKNYIGNPASQILLHKANVFGEAFYCGEHVCVYPCVYICMIV